MEQLVNSFTPPIKELSVAKLKHLLTLVKPNSKVSDMIQSLTEMNDSVSIMEWVAILQSLTPLSSPNGVLTIEPKRVLLNSSDLIGVLATLRDVFLVRPVSECGICGDQQDVHAVVLKPCHVCGFEICFSCSMQIEENRTLRPGQKISFNAFRCPGCRTLVPKATATIESTSTTITVTKDMVDLSRTLQLALCGQCLTIDAMYPLRCGASNEIVEDSSLFHLCKDCSPPLPAEPDVQFDKICECGIPYEKITDGLPIDEQDCNHLECECGKHICAMHGCGKMFGSRADCYNHMGNVHGGDPVPEGMSYNTYGFGGRYGGNIVCYTCGEKFPEDTPIAYDVHRETCM
jgi:hypothetical protein